MTRRPRDTVSISAPWVPLEADQQELETYVSGRLGLGPDDSIDAALTEPEWMDDAITHTWQAVLTEADTYRC